MIHRPPAASSCRYKKRMPKGSLSEIRDLGLPAAIVGEVTEKEPLKILVE